MKTDDWHSPLPWTKEEIGTSGIDNEFTVYAIRNGDGLCVIDGICDPEASDILRAVNSHADLVAALELIAEMPIPEQDNMVAANMRAAARAALSKAKE